MNTIYIVCILVLWYLPLEKHYPLFFSEPLIKLKFFILSPIPGFELAIRNSQFAKHFGSLRMSFCIFSKNCESLKSDTSWIFRVIHWTSYIGSYFKPNKYPMLNNNVISQRFIVHINFKSHTSFFSIILLRSNKS